MDEGYRPVEYWTRRLETDFSLRGTGHLSYSEAYNRWLYRAKGRALRRALEDLPPRAEVLDVGSGIGWVVAQLLARGAVVEGCDITEVAVRGLRERFGGGADRFFLADVGGAPLPRADASYDAVTALDVLYHVTDDDRWAAAVRDLARVLRAGGCLVVTDSFGPRGASPAPHVRFRAAAEWNEVAAGAGLQIASVHACYRWLSRDRGTLGLSWLPDGTRGAVEYALERAVPRRPHLRCTVLRRV